MPLSQLEEEAHARLGQLLAVQDGARRMVKQQMREPAAQELREAQSEDLDRAIRRLSHPAVQASIMVYLEGLQSKKKKKAEP